MKEQVQEQKQHYQQEFDRLLEQREGLVAKLNDTVKAIEQVRGAFAALNGLESADKPPKKKDKK